MKVKKLQPGAKIPTRSNSTDAGLDLYAGSDVLIPARSGAKIPTDISVQLPEKTVGLVCDRSSMGSKGLKVHGGVIDVGYTGNIIVCLWNHNDVDYEIKKGDKIAQLLVIPILTPIPEESDSLDESTRGDKGFGSSGR